jgi:hypothetical protein
MINAEVTEIAGEGEKEGICGKKTVAHLQTKQDN